MRLILEIDEPFLFFSVHVHRNYDTAGVDLVRLLLILELAFRFQLFHGCERKIHKAYKLIAAAFIQFFSVFQILAVSVLNGLSVIAFVKSDIGKFC